MRKRKVLVPNWLGNGNRLFDGRDPAVDSQRQVVWVEAWAPEGRKPASGFAHVESGKTSEVQTGPEGEFRPPSYRFSGVALLEGVKNSQDP